MMYRVIGTNKDTNAAMVLDIDAPSKAAAELAASARGMSVTDVQDVSADAQHRPASSHRGEGPADGSTPDSGGMRSLIIVMSILLVLALVGYFLLPTLLQKNVVPPTTRAAEYP